MKKASNEEVELSIINSEQSYARNSCSQPQRRESQQSSAQQPSLTSPRSTTPIPVPIQVIFEKNEYIDKERDIRTLKGNESVNEFLSWQKEAMESLSLIENYQEKILLQERRHISFSPGLTVEQIDTVYRTIWRKLHLATGGIRDNNGDLISIEPLEVSTLWRRLRTMYLPTTDEEKYRMENNFYSLEQGALATIEYINDESLQIFPQVDTCELKLHNFTTQREGDNTDLNTTLLFEQDGRPLPPVIHTQEYDEDMDEVQPSVLVEEEYRGKEKERRTEEREEQALMVVEEAIETEDEQPSAKTDLIFDSGATCHMWNHRAHFTTFEPHMNSNIKVVTVSGQKMDILGKGDIGPLKNVLYIPETRHCLISPTALLKRGYGTYCGTVPKIIEERNPSNVLLRGRYGGNLFRISAREFERQIGLRPITCFVHELSVQPLLQIHQMLGHASVVECGYECKCTNFPGLTSLSSKAFQAIRECEECAMNISISRTSLPGHIDIPKYIGQTWYVDVKGPVATPSLSHANHYVFGIIEVKTKFLLQYFMKNKDEVLAKFRMFHDEFIPYVRAIQPDLGAITVYSDQGEFHSKAVINFCKDMGIVHRITCAYCRENNALIERTWRSISEASIAMLLTANLTEPYWEEARRTAGYIRNRMVEGHSSMDDKSPYEKFFGFKPQIRHFKLFGVWAYPRICSQSGNHAAWVDKGIFVGYSDEIMVGYRIYFPGTNSFGFSNHVMFGKAPSRTNNETEGDVTSLNEIVTNLHQELLAVSSRCTMESQNQVVKSGLLEKYMTKTGHEGTVQISSCTIALNEERNNEPQETRADKLK